MAKKKAVKKEENLDELLMGLIQVLDELKSTVAANTILLSSFIYWVKGEMEHEA